MSRKVFSKKVRIQLAGQVVYVTPDDADPHERTMLLEAEKSGWRYTLRKSTINDTLIPTAAPLLRKDGSPRGITLMSGKKSPRLHVEFHQGKQSKLRFSLTVVEPGDMQIIFRKAINRIRSSLNLSDQQYDLLIDSWPAFCQRYFAKDLHQKS